MNKCIFIVNVLIYILLDHTKILAFYSQFSWHIQFSKFTQNGFGDINCVQDSAKYRKRYKFTKSLFLLTTFLRVKMKHVPKYSQNKIAQDKNHYSCY